MMTIKWTSIVIFCAVLLLFFIIFSLLFNKTGTFTTPDEIFGPVESRWLNRNMSAKDTQKFESKGEAISRACLENIYGVEFKNTRLDAIRNPNTSKKLEIDCYNEDLKIGLEYHGISHFKYVPFFHKNIQDFEDSQERDKFKEYVCEKLGICLIIVPYNTHHDKICRFIRAELKRNNKLEHEQGWKWKF